MKTQIKSVADAGLLAKEYRKNNEETQVDFAGSINVGTRFMSDLENGKNTMQFEKIVYVLNQIGYDLFAVKRGEADS